MPITNLMEALGVGPIIDAKIKISTTYSSLFQIQGIKAKPTFMSAEAKGFTTFALAAKPDYVDISIDMACLDVTLLRAILGSAAMGTTGTTPSIVETQAFKVTELCVYFELYVRSTDITGLVALTSVDANPADVWTHFPKCKLMDIGELLPSVKDYLTMPLSIKAVADTSGILWEYLLHETATVIA